MRMEHDGTIRTFHNADLQILGASLGITWPCIGFVISLFLFARFPSRASPKSSMGSAEEAVQARAHDQTWPPVASLTG